MKKEEFIRRRGKAAYERLLQQGEDWQIKHREEWLQSRKIWRESNPDKIKENSHEANRRGGKYYEHRLKYNSTGLQGERGSVRTKHAKHYRPFKKIIAPESQIHHERIPDTPKYRGVALVEKDSHQRGYIDVIQILEGNITLQTEEEIKLHGDLNFTIFSNY